MEKEREYWIDAVRSFACLCVITTHSPIPDGTSGLYVLPFSNYYAMSGGSILFFMISGALVLYKEKPIAPFLKRRFSRILLPTLIWTIVSMVVAYSLNPYEKWEFFHNIVSIPYSPYNTYWFIYVVLGIYLIAHPLQVWLARCSEREVRFYLLLWAATLLVPYLQLIDARFAALLRVDGGYLYYTYGYLGYALLGYYLRRYVSIDEISWKHIAIFSVVVILPWCLYLVRTIPHDVIQSRLTINAALLAMCYFVAIKRIRFSERWKKVCYNFANHSFGIYLVHVLIMRKLLWPLIEPLNLHYAVQIPLVVVLTATLSYFVVHLMSKLPYSRYVVGL